MNFQDLFNRDEFAARHISFPDQAALLAELGEKDMASFIGNTVPQSICMPGEVPLLDALSEADVLTKLKGLIFSVSGFYQYLHREYFPSSGHCPHKAPAM